MRIMATVFVNGRHEALDTRPHAIHETPLAQAHCDPARDHPHCLVYATTTHLCPHTQPSPPPPPLTRPAIEKNTRSHPDPRRSGPTLPTPRQVVLASITSAKKTSTLHHFGGPSRDGVAWRHHRPSLPRRQQALSCRRSRLLRATPALRAPLPSAPRTRGARTRAHRLRPAV